MWSCKSSVTVQQPWMSHVPTCSCKTHQEPRVFKFRILELFSVYLCFLWSFFYSHLIHLQWKLEPWVWTALVDRHWKIILWLPFPSLLLSQKLFLAWPCANNVFSQVIKTVIVHAVHKNKKETFLNSCPYLRFWIVGSRSWMFESGHSLQAHQKLLCTFLPDSLLV